MRILFAGGGSGGHVYPSVAVAQLALDQGYVVRFVASRDGLERPVLESLGFDVSFIDAVKLTSRNILKIGPIGLKGLFQAREIMKEFRPDVIYGTGGYVAFPALLAGWWAGVPRVIHEPNTVPGRANKLLAYLADRVLLSHAQTRSLFAYPDRCLVLGTPIRYSYAGKRIGSFPDTATRDLVDSSQGVASGVGMTLGILGGSQGARSVNLAVADLYPRLAGIEGLTVIHVTGRRDHEMIRERLAGSGVGNVELYPYVDDMESLMHRLDFGVCRAGAITVAELTEFEIPALFIPHEPSVGDHQRKNAQVLVEADAARILSQNDLTPDRLFDEISLFLVPEALEQRRSALRRVKRPGVARSHLDLLIQLGAHEVITEPSDCPNAEFPPMYSEKDPVSADRTPVP